MKIYKGTVTFDFEVIAEDDEDMEDKLTFLSFSTKDDYDAKIEVEEVDKWRREYEG